MRAQLRIFLLTLATAIVLVGMSSCAWTGSGGNTTKPTGPGAINATLRTHVLGGTALTKCTVHAISWTASSTAGSTQPKTSDPIDESDNVLTVCEELTLEGGPKTIRCSCPVTMSFTGLAAGTWTIQAENTNCSALVSQGQIVVMTMFTDGRACTKFP